MSEKWTRERLETYISMQYGTDESVASVVRLVRRWLDRGDGAAVYENAELGHPEAGMCQLVSYGSAAAQLETGDPPDQLPDIGVQINWRYRLVATCRSVHPEGGESGEL